LIVNEGLQEERRRSERQSWRRVQSPSMKSLHVSPDEFRRLASEVVEFAAGYLTGLDSRHIFPDTSSAASEKLFHAALPEDGLAADALAALQQVAGHSRVQNGRFFGYVLGSGESVAAVADLLASVLNQNVTAWRSSPVAVTIERTVIDWIGQIIGCAGFRGSLTGGGSSANLMALAMAREAALTVNEGGFADRQQGVLYASEEVHMSIPKSVALLGIGRHNLRLIATDDQFRMIPSELERMVQRDQAAGKTPIAIIASAGTVNTGAIDPLPEIAAIAQRHNTWLHVDGAYGALAAMTVPGKFVGLKLADSLSLDPHKWLYQPLDCGCLLYRDAAAAPRAFAHTGDYAKALTTDPIEGFAFFEESLELSRRFRALKLWLSLRYHGLQAFRAAIQRDLDHAQRLAAAIADEPELELLAPVPLSAICFRYKGGTPGSDDELDQNNAALLKRVIERGRVYLSNATIRGKFSLRACIVNHRTTDADVDSVVSEVLAAAQELS
jgi:aromatic-L-amino-acid/L-tryptophan decarboxylase